MFKATFWQRIQLEVESNFLEWNVNGLKIKLEKMYMIQVFAPSNLQPHYGNGVYGNVYLLGLHNAARTYLQPNYGNGVFGNVFLLAG